MTPLIRHVPIMPMIAAVLSSQLVSCDGNSANPPQETIESVAQPETEPPVEVTSAPSTEKATSTAIHAISPILSLDEIRLKQTSQAEEPYPPYVCCYALIVRASVGLFCPNDLGAQGHFEEVMVLEPLARVTYAWFSPERRNAPCPAIAPNPYGHTVRQVEMEIPISAVISKGKIESVSKTMILLGFYPEARGQAPPEILANFDTALHIYKYSINLSALLQAQNR